MKKWEIIRNENGEIKQYKLTNKIYIERDYTGGFGKDRYNCFLIVNGKIMGDNISGYTIKDLKSKGEKYL